MLGPRQRALLEEITAMLERLDPPQVDRSAVRVEPSEPELMITIPHRTVPDFAVVLEATERDIVVRYGNAEERFSPLDSYRDERSWTRVAADFVAEVLHGRLEVHTTFKGRAIVRVESFEVDEQGLTKARIFSERRRSIAALRPFLRKMTEIRRVSFIEPRAED